MLVTPFSRGPSLFFLRSPSLHRLSPGMPMSDYELFVPSRLRVIDGPRGPGRRERFAGESIAIFWEIGVKRRDIISHWLLLSLLYCAKILSFEYHTTGYFRYRRRYYHRHLRLRLLISASLHDWYFPGVLLPLGSLEAASPLAILSDGSQGKNPGPSCWARV